MLAGHPGFGSMDDALDKARSLGPGYTAAHVPGIGKNKQPYRVISAPTTMAAGGGMLGRGAALARGGLIGLAVAAVLGIPMILNSIRKNTEKSANNTTKSITDRNQLISATVLSHGTS